MPIDQVQSHAPFSLQEQLPSINRLFSIETKNVEAIFKALKADGSDFALKQLAILEKMVRSLPCIDNECDRCPSLEPNVTEAHLRTVEAR